MIACPVNCSSRYDLVLASARHAQRQWASFPLGTRLAVIKELRHRLAENADWFATLAGSVLGRPVAEKLVSEVLPLADGCRWLETKSKRLLAPRRHGRIGRPLWLHGVRFEVQRRPFGVVLVIGPGNYPLFLPAIQALYALVAGNAVLIKPAPGTRSVCRAFARLAQQSGIDPALLVILPENLSAAEETIREGVDKVVFTGSSENGRSVLKKLAEVGTPSVMELSGEDAVVVFADADLNLAMRALDFACRLNGGNTCMTPRRILAHRTIADGLQKELAEFPCSLPLDIFSTEDEALDLLDRSRYALGVSLFGSDLESAHAFADRVQAGFVVLNDIIVPTADPRMPFGGMRNSGFGTTRGPEGLLEMTCPHVVAMRSGRLRPHYDAPEPDDARLFTSYIRTAHGRNRLETIPELVGALLRRCRNKKKLP